MFSLFKKNKTLEKLRQVYTDLNQIEDKILFLTNETQNQRNSKYKTIINHLNGNIDGLTICKEFEKKYDRINFLSNEILKLHIEIKSELNDYNNLKYKEEMEKLN